MCIDNQGRYLTLIILVEQETYVLSMEVDI